MKTSLNVENRQEEKQQTKVITGRGLMVVLVLRDNRLCHSCGSNQIEDEFHLLFHCTKYCTFRDEFYKTIENQIPNITQLSPMQATKKLMNSDNYYLNTQLSDEVHLEMLIFKK